MTRSIVLSILVSKKIKEPKAMRELHEIREKMYSETEGMSMHERFKTPDFREDFSGSLFS